VEALCGVFCSWEGLRNLGGKDLSTGGTGFKQSCITPANTRPTTNKQTKIERKEKEQREERRAFHLLHPYHSTLLYS
jgi:hypothetical protein